MAGVHRNWNSFCTTKRNKEPNLTGLHFWILCLKSYAWTPEVMRGTVNSVHRASFWHHLTKTNIWWLVNYQEEELEKVLSVQFCDLIENCHLEKFISTMIYSSTSIHVLCFTLRYNEIWFSSPPPINVSVLFVFCCCNRAKESILLSFWSNNKVATGITCVILFWFL